VINRHLGIGWEFVHVCIEDASRIAFSRVMKDETKRSAVAFLKAAVTYYVSLGVKIERGMTDNGSCYRFKAFARAPQAIRPSSTSSPGLTRRRPTERPNASSRRACANGLTPAPTTPQMNVPPNCRDGFTATTGIGPMVVSVQSHPSADSA
jgi:hypothetical protein